MNGTPPLTGNRPLTAAVALVGFEAGDQDSITRIVDSSGSPLPREYKWQIHLQASVESTMASLRRERIPIILCDRDRTADAWKELLEQFDGLSSPPLLIVVSRLADDRLWVEALNLGAYDVLAKPFETAEVVRIFNLACLRWNQGNAALPAASAASATPAARYWVA
ncbi:MAG: hypothetical protein ABSH40_14025 [Bryobacteraceae bacterium]